jgi:anti-sigma B factor antagonist
LFDVTVTPAATDPSVTVVAVVGELDVATAPRLRQELIGLASHGSRRLVIDLAGVDFLDSTGVGVLLGAVRRARDGDGRIALANAEPQVARVFEVTRLVDILPLHASVDEATQALAGG